MTITLPNRLVRASSFCVSRPLLRPSRLTAQHEVLELVLFRLIRTNSKFASKGADDSSLDSWKRKLEALKGEPN